MCQVSTPFALPAKLCTGSFIDSRTAAEAGLGLRLVHLILLLCNWCVVEACILLLCQITLHGADSDTSPNVRVAVQRILSGVISQ